MSRDQPTAEHVAALCADMINAYLMEVPVA
jgi:hypothetical protein